MGMYNLKNVMLGFGLGLLVTSLININIQNKNITVDFLKNEALKKGLIVIDPKEIINKNVTLTEPKEENKESERNSDEKELEDFKSTEIVFVEARIEKGFDSYRTTDVLYNSGLIDDKDSFINLLYKLKKTNSIQYGVFFIQKGTSMEEIINIITNPRNIVN